MFFVFLVVFFFKSQDKLTVAVEFLLLNGGWEGGGGFVEETVSIGTPVPRREMRGGRGFNTVCVKSSERLTESFHIIIIHSSTLCSFCVV